MSLLSSGEHQEFAFFLCVCVCSIAMEKDEQVLQRLDDYFSQPEVTSYIGDFVSNAGRVFHFINHDGVIEPASSDTAEGLANYDVFKHYGEIVDSVLTQFVDSSHTEGQNDDDAVKQVLQAVQTEWKRCEGAASQYTAVESITAAIRVCCF